MKKRKLALAVVLLAFALACVIASSALSGEHPWDSDTGGNPGGGSGTGGPGTGDPTLPSTGVVTAKAPSSPGGSDLRYDLIFSTAKYVALYLVGEPGKYGVGRTRSVARTKASH